MQADEQEIRRLGSGGEHPSSLEARAGAFLHEARPLSGLSDAQVQAIEACLVHREGMRRGIRLVPVLVGVTVLLIAGSGMALVGGWRPRVRRRHIHPRRAWRSRPRPGRRPRRWQRSLRPSRTRSPSFGGRQGRNPRPLYERPRPTSRRSRVPCRPRHDRWPTHWHAGDAMARVKPPSRSWSPMSAASRMGDFPSSPGSHGQRSCSP